MPYSFLLSPVPVPIPNPPPFTLLSPVPTVLLSTYFCTSNKRQRVGQFSSSAPAVVVVTDYPSSWLTSTISHKQA